MDPVRVVLMVLVSIGAFMPMMVWLLLGGTGALGEFGSTQAYEIIKFCLVGLTCIFYFVLSPFVIWPKLLNRPDEEEKKQDRDGSGSAFGS